MRLITLALLVLAAAPIAYSQKPPRFRTRSERAAYYRNLQAQRIQEENNRINLHPETRKPPKDGQVGKLDHNECKILQFTDKGFIAEFKYQMGGGTRITSSSTTSGIGASLGAFEETTETTPRTYEYVLVHINADPGDKAVDGDTISVKTNRFKVVKPYEYIDVLGRRKRIRCLDVVWDDKDEDKSAPEKKDDE